MSNLPAEHLMTTEQHEYLLATVKLEGDETNKTFTYLVHPELELTESDLVVVPFGPKIRLAYVTSIYPPLPQQEFQFLMKPIMTAISMKEWQKMLAWSGEVNERAKA